MDKRITKESLWRAILRWFDTETDNPHTGQTKETAPERLDWVRLIPFIGLHLGCLGVIITGISLTAVVVCVLLYMIRMFAITGFYHRYFSHRAFKTNRFWQFIFAVLGNAAAQRGPLWWAGHHRHHHLKSDDDDDIHSPITQGFWWSHIGWFSCDKAFATPWHRIKDFAAYPELRFLNRFDVVVPILMALCLYVLGECLDHYYPHLQTTGLQLLVWGFCISTVLVFHATSTINSLGHLWGKRRYSTADQSRNNALLALITFGEGWHNNHHRWPVSARQGFYWWEIDLCYYGLKLLETLGIIWDLKPVPERIRIEGRKTTKRETL
jgi:stearoyl-CoA desaturase (delta-9 desaturase)